MRLDEETDDACRTVIVESWLRASCGVIHDAVFVMTIVHSILDPD
jgi:hypothetical protein